MTDTPERMTPEAAQPQHGDFYRTADGELFSVLNVVDGAMFGRWWQDDARDWLNVDPSHTLVAVSAERYAALAQRVEEWQQRSFEQSQTIARLTLDKQAAEARADALEKEAGRLREFVRRCSYAHLFPVDGLKLSSEAKAALSEPSDDTPTPSEADDHGG